jgi:hypothetical protein
MNFIRTLLQALSNAWHHDPQAAHDERRLAGAVDIYELERRMAEQAQTRLVLYASGVGR